MSKKSQRDMGDAFGSFMNESAADASNRILNVPGDALPEFNTVNSDKIRYIDIFSIEPDPMQPRRAIPHDLRAGQIRAADMPAFLQHWSAQAGIDIRQWLEHAGDDDRQQPENPVQAALMALVDFAASIRRDGLLNAITLVDTGGITGSYSIETGERRWLAFHVLHSVYGDAYQTISARIMPQRDVWRQATENNARENLNAIARARQLAILLMDLHGLLNFRPLSDFAHEQDFYAQVADSVKWRVPDGKAAQVLNAMNMKTAAQLRQYRALLRLPRQAWVIADDENIGEYALREMKNAAGDDDKRLIELIMNYRVTAVTRPGENRVSTVTRPENNSGSGMPAVEGSPRFTKFWNNFHAFQKRQQSFIRQASESERQQAIQALEQMIADLRAASKRK